MVMLPSHFMPLPPEPVLFSVSVPPSMVIVPSALRHAAAFVSRSSVSHIPLPEVVMLMVPAVTYMSPSLFTPLPATAVLVMVSVPPSR